MSCRQYVCFNLVHCVMFCWQINDDDDDDESCKLFDRQLQICHRDDCGRSKFQFCLFYYHFVYILKKYFEQKEKVYERLHFWGEGEGISLSSPRHDVTVTHSL